MRALILALSVPLVLVAPGVAQASMTFSVVQHDGFPPDLGAQVCDGSTQGQEVCLARKLKVVDHKIDLVASSLRKASFDSPAKGRVDQAEKAWFAFRDADCRSSSDLFEGGTEAGVLFEGCELGDSNARLKQLKQQLANLAENG